MIVGESLFGVLLAGLIVALNRDAPFNLVPENFAPAHVIGIVSYVVAIALVYGWLIRRAGSNAPMTEKETRKETRN